MERKLTKREIVEVRSLINREGPNKTLNKYLVPESFGQPCVIQFPLNGTDLGTTIRKYHEARRKFFSILDIDNWMEEWQVLEKIGQYAYKKGFLPQRSKEEHEIHTEKQG